MDLRTMMSLEGASFLGPLRQIQSGLGLFVGGTRGAQTAEIKRSNMFLEKLVRGVTGIDERVSKIKVGWV